MAFVLWNTQVLGKCLSSRSVEAETSEGLPGAHCVDWKRAGRVGSLLKLGGGERTGSLGASFLLSLPSSGLGDGAGREIAWLRWL
jgi:hypothetical protein